jgi:hypothetical protein
MSTPPKQYKTYGEEVWKYRVEKIVMTKCASLDAIADGKSIECRIVHLHIWLFSCPTSQRLRGLSRSEQTTGENV